MKFTALSASVALFASSALAHTWLECVDTVIHNEAEARDPNVRAAPDYECKGYPRNKLYDGDWIVESSKYSYTLNNPNAGLDTKYACRQDVQGTFGQEAPGKPMVTARPGQKLNMRFWGNGHTDYHVGSPRNCDPGVVRVYWPGKPDTQIDYKEDLTEKYWIPGAQSNFSANSITWRDVTPMLEPGNFMEFTVPEKIQNGVHAMVFAWANKPGPSDPQPLDANVYNNYWQNSFTTCFDIKIEGSNYDADVSDVVKANQEGYDERKEENSLLQQLCAKSCKIAGGEECFTNCPPCRVGRGDGGADCYEYKPGTTMCEFDGKDCTNVTYKKRSVLARSHARKHRRAHRF